MRVALIHDWLTGMRGGEKCLEVFCELYPDADLYTLVHMKGSVSTTIENMKIHTSFIQRLPFIKKKYRYYLPLFPTAVEKFNLHDYDLVLSSSHCVAKGAIPSPTACHISYMYTPMRYVWDLYNDYFGETENRKVIRQITPFLAHYLRMWDAVSCNRVDHFVAISQHVQRRIKKYYRRDAVVIYPPVDTTFFQPLDNMDDFYLMVTAFVPYKRADVAIASFNSLGLSLKIIGSGPEENRLKKMAKSNIEFLGWLPDDLLKDYYARCKAVIFPGEEDFGIVPVEAMASGKPVIAYGRGGALETIVPLDRNKPYEDQVPTGIFFYEQTVDALIEAVHVFEKNIYAFDGKKIRAHALKFDRSVFKEKMKRFIDEKYEMFRMAGG